MVRRLLARPKLRVPGGLVLGLLSVACSGRRVEPPEALVLHDFRLVDIEAGAVRDGDVTIENGVVVARPTLARQRVVEGHGAFLMPALWDLKASLWGNDSALNWDVLTQEANFTQCLGFQLYYGVAHVGVFGMRREWVERELKRADALELTAAEPLYPDHVICGAPSFACDSVQDAAGAQRAVAERKRHHAPLIYVSLTRTKKDPTAGVSREVLAEVIGAAAAIPTFVLVDDWAQAEQAAQLGAKVIYGLPAEPIPDALLELMLARGAAFAPALTRYLELDRLLGNRQALNETFLSETVRADVRASFENEQRVWSEFLPDLRLGRQRRAAALESVARLAKAGVPLIAVSDAGWTGGTFQGYSSQALQAWLERAGIAPWQRLAAATTAPAALFGRHVGFSPGQAADFVAYDDSPLGSAESVKQIELVIRRGKLVDRAKLLPDLTRGKYEP